MSAALAASHAKNFGNVGLEGIGSLSSDWILLWMFFLHLKYDNNQVTVTKKLSAMSGKAELADWFIKFVKVFCIH